VPAHMIDRLRTFCLRASLRGARPLPRTTEPEMTEARPRRGALQALGFAIVTFLLRVPFLSLPFGQQDEGYYAAIARAVAEGRGLYADLGYVRPPGLNVPYALAWKVSEAIGVRYDLTVRVFAALVAAAAVGLLAAYLFRRFDTLAATFGSTLAALLSASLTLQNEANSETWLMLPYVASALLVLWAMDRAMPPGRWRAAMLIAGALTGVAALFKEVALVNLAVPLLAAFTLLDERRVRRGLVATAFFAGGVLIVEAGVLTGLAATGQARDFLYHTWFTRLFYVADTHMRVSVADILVRQLRLLRVVFVAPLVATLATAIAAVAGSGVERSRERRMVLFALGWLVVSAVGVAASGRFYQHYFIQATIPLALLLSASLAAFARPVGHAGLRWAVVIAATVGCALPAYAWVADTGTISRLSDSRGVWRELAERADAVTPAGGTLFVWGDLVSVRAYSHVPAATDVVWVYYGFGRPGGEVALGRWFPSVGDRLLTDLKARPPDTIVLTAQLGEWLPGVRVSPLQPADDLRVEDALLETIAEDFRLVERDSQYAVFTRVR